MASLAALSPPLGQHPWGQAFQSAYGTGYQVLPLPYGVQISEITYPPLTASGRVLLLLKYPGTILPDPDQEDVIPGPDPDPVHIEEISNKYDAAIQDAHLYDDIPTKNLATFIECEVAEWVTEFEALHGAICFTIASRSIMDLLKPRSKKRARLSAFKEYASVAKTESRAAKKIKRGPSSTTVPDHNPSLKDRYDTAFPADVVVDQDSPAYIMALNYLKSYSKSQEKYARQVSEIIARQGMDAIAQRCAKFFAWALKQAIHSLKVESADKTPAQTVEHAVETARPVIDTNSEDEEDNSDYDEIDLEDSDDEEEIINFQPLDMKPTIKFEKSNTGERLESFLTELNDANKELKHGPKVSIEVSDSEEEHIAMNLGLGVLEEVTEDNEVILEMA